MTMVNWRSAVLAAAALLAMSGALPAAAAPRDPLAGFDADVRRGVADWQVPGLAVAVVKDGKVAFARGYGVREAGGTAAVDADTRFALASTCKALTAAGIALLVEAGKVAWDDPVTKYLPWFALKDPYATREVTVRDLLTHRAGLGNTDYLWYGQSIGREEVVRRLRLADPAYSLRSSFVYQNVMYGAAGLVIEAASGMEYTKFIETRIFAPLGMKQVVPFDLARAGTDNVALPHYLIDGKVVPIQQWVGKIDGLGPDPIPSAGTFRASVNDMARWITMLLADGKGPDGKQFLKTETVAELFRPQTLIPAEEFYPTRELTQPNWMSYGLAWFQQDYRGHKVDFHTGSLDGSIAIVGLIRDLDLGVVVFGNLDHAELRHALMLQVFDRYLGEPRRDWSRDLKAHYAALRAKGEAERAKVEAERVTGTKPALPLAGYAGRYSDPLRGEVNVEVDADSLRLRVGAGITAALEHWHYDTFRTHWDAAFLTPDLVTFTLGTDGKVDAVTLQGARFARAPAAQ